LFKNLFLIKLSKLLAKIAIDLSRSDKSSIRKICKELWDLIIEIFVDKFIFKKFNFNNELNNSSLLQYDASNYELFSGLAKSSISNESLNINFIKQSIKNFIMLIKNPNIVNILISVLLAIENVVDSQINIDLYNELRYLWPTSVANSNSLNLNSLIDLLNSLLYGSLIRLDPFNCTWLCSNADVHLAQGYYSEVIKLLLQVFICESRYFFREYPAQIKTRKEDKNAGGSNEELFFDEKNIKSLIKCSLQLNKYTQAALLTQILATTNDYSNAFRFLQDKMNLNSDDMDALYDYIWDLTLLEYLTNLNHVRGYKTKARKLIKLCNKETNNASNLNELNLKNMEVKRVYLFLHLIRNYLVN
jgi:hypothetical protein